MTNLASVQRSRLNIAALAVLILGSLLRIGGLATDFWLDEVWTYNMARQLTSWTEVFTALNVDGNHHLITLWIYCIGDAAPEWAYRLPSLLAGIAPMIVIYWAWRKSEQPVVMVFLVLFASSYPLCHYASEARGYSLAAGILTITWILTRERQPRTAPMLLAYNAALVAGVLANLTFLFCCVGFGFMMIQRGFAAEEKRTLQTFARQVVASVLRHTPALIMLLALYVADIRLMEFGLAREYTPILSTCAALSWQLGLNIAGPAAIGTAAIVVALSIAGLWALWAQRRFDQVAFGVGLYGSCAIVWSLRFGSYIHARYFVVILPYMLWSLAALWQHLQGSATGRRIAYAVLTGLALVGTCYSIGLTLNGRGHYKDAIEFIGESSVDREISVTTDFDFRGEMLLEFYSNQLPPGKTFILVPNGDVRTAKPEWIILQKPTEFELLRLEDNSAYYQLVRSYGRYGLAGTEWHLYRIKRPEKAERSNSPK